MPHCSKGTGEKAHTEKSGSSELASLKLSPETALNGATTRHSTDLLCEEIKEIVQFHGICIHSNDDPPSELCQQIEKHCNF